MFTKMPTRFRCPYGANVDALAGQCMLVLQILHEEVDTEVICKAMYIEPSYVDLHMIKDLSSDERMMKFLEYAGSGHSMEEALDFFIPTGLPAEEQKRQFQMRLEEFLELDKRFPFPEFTKKEEDTHTYARRILEKTLKELGCPRPQMQRMRAMGIVGKEAECPFNVWTDKKNIIYQLSP